MKYLAFDIETAKEWPDRAGWRKYRPVGISCAATLPSDAASPRLWHGLTDDDRPAGRMSKAEAAELVDYLTAMADDGDSIVTWNGLSFDFDILAWHLAPKKCRMEVGVRITRPHLNNRATNHASGRTH